MLLLFSTAIEVRFMHSFMVSNNLHYGFRCCTVIGLSDVQRSAALQMLDYSSPCCCVKSRTVTLCSSTPRE